MGNSKLKEDNILIPLYHDERTSTHKKHTRKSVSSMVVIALVCLLIASQWNGSIINSKFSSSLRKFGSSISSSFGDATTCSSHGVIGNGKCLCDLGYAGSTCKQAVSTELLDPQDNTVLIIANQFGALGTSKNFKGENPLNLAIKLNNTGYSVTVLYTGAESALLFGQQSLKYKKQGLIMKRLLDVSTGLNYGKNQAEERSYEVYQYLIQSPEQYSMAYFNADSGEGFFTLLAQKQGLICSKTKFIVGVDALPAGDIEIIASSDPHHIVSDVATLKLDYMHQKSAELANTLVVSSGSLLNALVERNWDIDATAVQIIEPITSDFAYHRSNYTEMKEIVFVGTLAISDGLKVFSTAIDQIANELGDSGIKVTFAGIAGTIEGIPSEEWLEIHCSGWADIGLTWNIHKITGTNDILEYMAASIDRVAVLPTLSDTSSILSQELLYAGFPFIASTQNAVKHMIKSRDISAILFHPNSLVLSKKLLEMINQKAIVPSSNEKKERSTKKWKYLLERVKSDQSSTCVTKYELEDNQPLVSIVLVHHNRGDLLRQAVESLEAQTYPNVEVILIDDGSTDKYSLQVLESITWGWWETKGWKVVREKNKYLGAARNTGVRHATGKYIVFMDDDDYAKPHLVETLLKVAINTDAEVVTSGHDLFTGNSYPGDVSQKRYLPLGPAKLAGILENIYGDSKFLVNRETFLAIGGFTEDYGVGFEDYEFLAKAVLKGKKLEAVSEPLNWYRRHSNVMSYQTNLKANQMRMLRAYNEVNTKAPQRQQELLQYAQELFFDKHSDVAFALEKRDNNTVTFVGTTTNLASSTTFRHTASSTTFRHTNTKTMTLHTTSAQYSTHNPTGTTTTASPSPTGPPIHCHEIEKDCMGYCPGEPKYGYIMDCTGKCASKDEAVMKDKCGQCGGKNECVDCKGVPFGNATLDACNVCGGVGDTCSAFVGIEPSVVPNKVGQKITLFGAGFSEDTSKVYMTYSNTVPPTANDIVSKSSLQFFGKQWIVVTLTSPFYSKADVVYFWVNENGVLINKQPLSYFDPNTNYVSYITPNMVDTQTPSGAVPIGLVGSLISFPTAICVFEAPSLQLYSPAEFNENRAGYRCMTPFFENAGLINVHLLYSKPKFTTPFYNVNELVRPELFIKESNPLSLYVMEKAPQITSSIFEDSGSSILVEFDKPVVVTDAVQYAISPLQILPVSFDGFVPCSAAFDITNLKNGRIALSPDDCQLQHVAPSVLRLIIQAKFTFANQAIEPNDALGVRNNAIVVADVPYSRASKSSIVVEGPRNPFKPIIEVVAPAVIGSCDDLVLDFSRTYGSGGRPWKSVDIAIKESDITIEEALKLGSNNIANGISSFVTIKKSMLSPSNYTFTAKFENWLGQSDMITIMIEKLDSSNVPLVLVSSENAISRMVYTGNPQKLIAKVVPSECKEEHASINFEWTLLEGDTSFAISKKFNQYLEIPPFVLKPNTDYIFNVAVGFVGKPTFNFPIRIQTAPTEYDSLAISQTFSSNSQIVVKQQIKQDGIEVSNDGFDCAWECVDLITKRRCNLGQQLLMSCTIDLTGKLPNGQFFFSMTAVTKVTKNIAINNSGLLVNVVSEKVPMVAIDISDYSPASSIPLTLNAMVDPKSVSSVQNTIISWSAPKKCTNGDPNQHFGMNLVQGETISTNPSGNILKFMPDVLQPSSSICIKVTVTDTFSGSSGESFVELRIRDSPVAGFCKTSIPGPLLRAYVDKFTASCYGWTTDPKSYPILFQFGMKRADGCYEKDEFPSIKFLSLSSSSEMAVAPGKFAINILLKDYKGSSTNSNEMLFVDAAMPQVTDVISKTRVGSRSLSATITATAEMTATPTHGHPSSGAISTETGTASASSGALPSPTIPAATRGFQPIQTDTTSDLEYILAQDSVDNSIKDFGIYRDPEAALSNAAMNLLKLTGGSERGQNFRKSCISLMSEVINSADISLDVENTIPFIASLIRQLIGTPVCNQRIRRRALDQSGSYLEEESAVDVFKLVGQMVVKTESIGGDSCYSPFTTTNFAVSMDAVLASLKTANVYNEFVASQYTSILDGLNSCQFKNQVCGQIPFMFAGLALSYSNGVLDSDKYSMYCNFNLNNLSGTSIPTTSGCVKYSCDALRVNGIFPPNTPLPAGMDGYMLYNKTISLSIFNNEDVSVRVEAGEVSGAIYIDGDFYASHNIKQMDPQVVSITGDAYNNAFIYKDSTKTYITSMDKNMIFFKTNRIGKFGLLLKGANAHTCDGIVDFCGVCNGKGDEPGCFGIQGLEPSYIPAVDGITFTIVGAGFTKSGTTVFIEGNEVPEEQLNFVSPQFIVVTLPKALPLFGKDISDTTVTVYKVGEPAQNLFVLNYYDAEKTKVQAVNPNKVKALAETEIKMSGEQIFNTPSPGCVFALPQGFISTAGIWSRSGVICDTPMIPETHSKVKVYLMYSKVKYAVPAIFHYTDYLLPEGQDLTIIAIGPQVESAKFTQSGGSIEVIFDRAVKVVDPTQYLQSGRYTYNLTEVDFAGSVIPCSAVFNIEASLLGKVDSDCTLTKSAENTLLISMEGSFTNAYAAAAPGNDLIFSENSIISASYEFSYASSGSVLIQQPDIISPPVIQIFAPRIISLCPDLILDLSFISGSAGRQWKSVSITATPNVTDTSDSSLNTFLASQSTLVKQGQLEIILDNTIMVSRKYVFTLEYENFLGGKASYEYAVERFTDNSVPYIVLLSDNGLNELASESLQILRAKSIPICGITTTVNYKWTSLQVNSAGSVVLDESAITSSSIVLKPYTLSPNTSYYFEVEAGFEGTASYTFPIEILTRIDQIFASPGASLKIGTQNPTFVQNAIIIDNAYKKLSDAEFLSTWSCKSNGEDCFAADGVTKLDLTALCVDTSCASIDLEGHLAAGEYEFGISVQNINTKSVSFPSNPAYITVVEGLIPIVRINPSDLVPGADQESFVLKAEVDTSSIIGKGDFSYEWSLESSCNGISYPTAALEKGVNTRTDPKTASALKFLPGTLKSSTSYCVKVMASFSAYNETGEATVVIKTREAPSAGICSTKLATGNAYTDILSIACTGWVTDPLSYPLNYQISMRPTSSAAFTASSFSPVAPRGMSSQYSSVFPVPPSGITGYQVLITVVDQSNSASTINSNMVIEFTINTPQVVTKKNRRRLLKRDLSVANQELENFIASATARYNSGKDSQVVVANLVTAVNSLPDDVTDASLSGPILQSKIIDLLSLTVNSGDWFIDTVVQAPVAGTILKKLVGTKYAMSTEASDSIFLNTKNIIANIVAGTPDSCYNAASAAKIQTAIDAVVSSVKAIGTYDATIAAALNDLSFTMAQCQSKIMVCGQSAQIYSGSNYNMTTGHADLLLSDSISCDITPVTPSGTPAPGQQECRTYSCSKFPLTGLSPDTLIKSDKNVEKLDSAAFSFVYLDGDSTSSTSVTKYTGKVEFDSSLIPTDNKVADIDVRKLDNGNLSNAVLGKDGINREATVDYGSGFVNFQSTSGGYFVAALVDSNSVTPPPIPVGPTPSPIGIIAGAVGGALGLAILGAGIWAANRRKRRRLLQEKKINLESAPAAVSQREIAAEIPGAVVIPISEDIHNAEIQPVVRSPASLPDYEAPPSYSDFLEIKASREREQRGSTSQVGLPVEQASNSQAPVSEQQQ